MAARKKKAEQEWRCGILANGGSVPEVLLAKRPYQSRRQTEHRRLQLYMWEVIDGKTVDEAIAALQNLKEKHGDVTLDFYNGDDYESAHFQLSIMRPMTPEELIENGELDKKQKSERERVEREQFEALRKKFGK